MNCLTTQSGIQRHLRAATWAVLGCLCLWSVNSQAEDADPASRIARVSYLKGQVYVQTTDDDAWRNAGINQPLTSSDQLWTDDKGRAELQMGSTALQIDANTQLRLLELSDDVLQVEVTQGVVNVHVRNLSRNDTVEIDTPNAAITAQDEGTYRIEVADRDQQTLIQVRQGRAEVTGEKQSFNLRADEQLSLRGDTRLTADFDNVPRMDEFDRWANERNERAGRVSSSRYVSADVIGYEDLDDYGYWRYYNDYGYVWQPTRIVSGWAPYRFGHWVWVTPWGWTWVDDAPWGFAPFHYGRWTTIDNRWCWVPGPRTVRAVYAPALVAWVGTPGLSVSVSIGAQPVGWIPLGPREVYRPVYRSSPTYILNINLSNSRLNRNEFDRDYRRSPRDISYGNRAATTVVQASAFRDPRPINNHLIKPENGRLQPVDSTPVARPERGLRPSNERITPPINANSRNVLARRQPLAPNNSGDNNTLGKPNNVRVIDPATVRRPDSNSRNDSRIGNPERNEPGRAVNTAPDANRPNNSRNDGASRVQRDTQREDTAPSNRTRTITTSPYVRPENRNEQRSNPSQPSSSPSAASPNSATPEGQSRERNRSWVRDEAQLGRSRGADNSNNATPERERTPTPTPAPQRREESAQPAPSTPAVTPARPSEPQRRPDEDEQRRRRGLGGDVR
ncbi:MAG: FecR domain-containing protein [Steroidobacteraceae bacterium]